MNTKSSKILIITVSLALLGISLTQNAIVTNHYTDAGLEVQTSGSLDLFLMGSTAFLGGGILEEIIWLANPLSLLAIIMLVKNNPQSKKTGLIALALAVSFAFWREILANEGGGMAKIASLEMGYYLWVLSILVLNMGIHLYFYTGKKTPPTLA